MQNEQWMAPVSVQNAQLECVFEVDIGNGVCVGALSKSFLWNVIT